MRRRRGRAFAAYVISRVLSWEEETKYSSGSSVVCSWLMHCALLVRLEINLLLVLVGLSGVVYGCYCDSAMIEKKKNGKIKLCSTNGKGKKLLLSLRGRQ